MKFATILVTASAVFFGVALASPIEAESSVADRAIKCAYKDCSACHAYCWNDMPCSPDHDCGIQRAGCILLCQSTNCCD